MEVVYCSCLSFQKKIGSAVRMRFGSAIRYCECALWSQGLLVGSAMV